MSETKKPRREKKITSLKGMLLVATPSMSDPRFHKSVIFMCNHDDKGAMGLAINNVLPGMAFENMIEHFNIPISDPEKAAKTPVIGGGPVETARGFILHKTGYQVSDTLDVTDDFAITGTVDALKAVARGEGPDPMIFILGYAGWTPGQLERELQENAWLTVEPDPALLFDVPPEHKWKMALGKIGIEPGLFSTQAGHA
jgi:putative transcriptional regulator